MEGGRLRDSRESIQTERIDGLWVFRVSITPLLPLPPHVGKGSIADRKLEREI